MAKILFKFKNFLFIFWNILGHPSNSCDNVEEVDVVMVTLEEDLDDKIAYNIAETSDAAEIKELTAMRTLVQEYEEVAVTTTQESTTADAKKIGASVALAIFSMFMFLL